MIKVKIRGPTALQGVSASTQHQFPFGRRRLWIGRGQQILQKQNQNSYVLNVNEISKSVSRVHACLLYSPAFWMGYDNSHPTYYKKLKPLKELPDYLLFQIWEFCRPARKILLKDMHSKTGVYKKVRHMPLETGMEVVLGDSRPLVFHHREIYDSREELRERVLELREKGHVIINDFGGEPLSFWTFTFKNQNYILLDASGKVTIGRSSNNHFVICEASISRRHATLEYVNSEWRISDGDGSANVSSNGVWQRVKKLQLDYRSRGKEMEGGQSTVKLGDILFSFDIKEDYSHLNISEICGSYKNSTNESFNNLMRKEMEELPLVRLAVNSEELVDRKKARMLKRESRKEEL